MFFRWRNQHEEAQEEEEEEKGSQQQQQQQQQGVVTWQETAFKLLVFELVSVGIPLLVLRLINKVLARSA